MQSQPEPAAAWPTPEHEASVFPFHRLELCARLLPLLLLGVLGVLAVHSLVVDAS